MLDLSVALNTVINDLDKLLNPAKPLTSYITGAFTADNIIKAALFSSFTDVSTAFNKN